MLLQCYTILWLINRNRFYRENQFFLMQLSWLYFHSPFSRYSTDVEVFFFLLTFQASSSRSGWRLRRFFLKQWQPVRKRGTAICLSLCITVLFGLSLLWLQAFLSLSCMQISLLIMGSLVNQINWKEILIKSCFMLLFFFVSLKKRHHLDHAS